MIYQGTLVKISQNDTALRTDTIQGIFYEMPCPGFQFTIIGEPLNDDVAYRRHVTTSTVARVFDEIDHLRIFTQNSEYLLLLSDGPESLTKIPVA